MNPTVLLARHGAHDELNRVLSGRSEIALNPTGRGEAARLAQWLAAIPLTAVHSSPRRRARETAEIVAQPHRLSVEVFDALDEIDFGDWAGCSFEALAADPLWQRWNGSRGSAVTRGGEDMASAIGRAARHIEGLDCRGGAVLCVSHCDIIRGVVALYQGRPIDEMLTIEIDTASLSVLEPRGRRLLAVNEPVA